MLFTWLPVVAVGVGSNTWARILAVRQQQVEFRVQLDDH